MVICSNKKVSLTKIPLNNGLVVSKNPFNNINCSKVSNSCDTKQSFNTKYCEFPFRSLLQASKLAASCSSKLSRPIQPSKISSNPSSPPSSNSPAGSFLFRAFLLYDERSPGAHVCVLEFAEPILLQRYTVSRKVAQHVRAPLEASKRSQKTCIYCCCCTPSGATRFFASPFFSLSLR